MFEPLTFYKSILVVGPQRAGSRIAAKCISADTGYEYVDERMCGIGGSSHIATMEQLEKRQVVVRAPGMTFDVHEIVKEIDSILVVMVHRNLDDILASQEKLNWQNEDFELQKYGLKPGNGPSAAVKYNVWEIQKKGMPDMSYMDLVYDSLKRHPLFITKNLRRDWAWNQTEMDTNG